MVVIEVHRREPLGAVATDRTTTVLLIQHHFDLTCAQPVRPPVVAVTQLPLHFGQLAAGTAVRVQPLSVGLLPALHASDRLRGIALVSLTRDHPKAVATFTPVAVAHPLGAVELVQWFDSPQMRQRFSINAASRLRSADQVRNGV